MRGRVDDQCQNDKGYQAYKFVVGQRSSVESKIEEKNKKIEDLRSGTTASKASEYERTTIIELEVAKLKREISKDQEELKNIDKQIEEAKSALSPEIKAQVDKLEQMELKLKRFEERSEVYTLDKLNRPKSQRCKNETFLH